MAVPGLVAAMRVTGRTGMKRTTKKLVHGVGRFMVAVDKHRFAVSEKEFFLALGRTSYMLKDTNKSDNQSRIPRKKVDIYIFFYTYLNGAFHFGTFKGKPFQGDGTLVNSVTAPSCLGLEGNQVVFQEILLP